MTDGLATQAGAGQVVIVPIYKTDEQLKAISAVADQLAAEFKAKVSASSMTIATRTSPVGSSTSTNSGRAGPHRDWSP